MDKSSDSTIITNIPFKTILVIALMQGCALLFLHRGIELDYWLYEQPQWLLPLYSIAITIPIMLLLSLSVGSQVTVLRWTVGFAALVFAMGFYIGNQLLPYEGIKNSPTLLIYGITLLLATFKALIYVQHFASKEPLSYSVLFRLSWRNFLTLLLSQLFVVGFGLLLLLWAGLFAFLKISYFGQLFKQPEFLYPSLALMNGLGIIIFRKQSHIIDTITRIQQALMKFLLANLILISIVFLIILLFTGLKPLWSVGGSGLILLIQALLLFFLNAVYQDDPDSIPYPIWLHRFIYLGIALLPIYSVISFYGLSLRVEQYGWSVFRCWAFLLWAVFALFSATYLWGIIKLKDRWLHQLSWVNVRMGLIVLALAILANSPVLDFRKITVSSQLDRLNSGMINADEFDYSYFHKSLLKPGRDALDMLDKRYYKSSSVAEIIKGIRQKKKKIILNEEDFISVINLLDQEIPDDLGPAIYSHLVDRKLPLNSGFSYHLLALKLNNDSQEEYVLLSEGNKWAGLTLYYWEDKQWKNKAIDPLTSLGGKAREKRSKALAAAIKNKTLIIKNPQWNDIEVNGSIYRVR